MWQRLGAPWALSLSGVVISLWLAGPGTATACEGQNEGQRLSTAPPPAPSRQCGAVTSVCTAGFGKRHAPVSATLATGEPGVPVSPDPRPLMSQAPPGTPSTECWIRLSRAAHICPQLHSSQSPIQ